MGAFLNAHPEIETKRLYAQEGHYFDIACVNGAYECDNVDKMRAFLYTANTADAAWRSNLRVIEKSPNYFQSLWIPRLIHQYNPNVKIIIVTCDPAARAYSDFKHMEQVKGHSIKLAQKLTCESVTQLGVVSVGENLKTVLSESKVDYRWIIHFGNYVFLLLSLTV